MRTTTSSISETIAQHRLSTSEHASYLARRRYCSSCLSCNGIGSQSVVCRATDQNGRVDLIHGECPKDKWGVSSVIPDSGYETNHLQQGAPPCSDLFVYGFPGLYAGANTELHHQILLWQSMGINTHLIPDKAGFKQEPLYPEMEEIGVIIHQQNQFDAILPGAPVLGFCNEQFLIKIDTIRQYTHYTVFVNCMTWLFDLEKRRHREGKISLFLFQNDEIRKKNQALLRKINPDPDIHYLTFQPYFETEVFPFVSVDQRIADGSNRPFTIGRISRQDADKFSADTVRVWEGIESPVSKRGVMLGFGPESERKIGKPPEWVETFINQTELSQQDFYKQVDVIVQPMDTTENWPRIGLEAMSSGCVLIVDNRGGWRQMIEHGETGWLCNSPEDFIRYATRMANEPEKRAEMAQTACHRLHELSGKPIAQSAWSEVLNRCLRRFTVSYEA
ncbi:MAG: glycosyltransferase [Planctomycetota bacterium]